MNAMHVMKMAGIIVRIVICVLTGLFITDSSVCAGTGIFAKDVMKNAEKYYNQKFVIKGRVTAIRGGESGAAGSYLLRDGEGTEVEIFSRMLPMTGKKYKVTVEVKEGMPPGPPRFVEIGRTQSKTWQYVAYVFAGLGAVLAAALVLGGSGSTDSGVRGV